MFTSYLHIFIKAQLQRSVSRPAAYRKDPNYILPISVFPGGWFRPVRSARVESEGPRMRRPRAASNPSDSKKVGAFSGRAGPGWGGWDIPARYNPKVGEGRSPGLTFGVLGSAIPSPF